MKLYVGNLNEKTGENDLRNLFSAVGDLVNVSIIKDKHSGNSKGFGFIEFESQKLGQTAISKFNGHLLNGAQITVNEARGNRRTERSRRW